MVKDFAKNYEAKAVLEIKNHTYLLAITKKSGSAYYIPLIKDYFRLDEKISVIFYKKQNEYENLKNCHDFRVSEDGKTIIYKKTTITGEHLHIAKAKSPTHWKTILIQKEESGIAVPSIANINNKKTPIALITKNQLHISSIEKDSLITHRKTVRNIKDYKILGVKNIKEGIFSSLVKIEKRKDDWHIKIIGLIIDGRNPWHVLWHSDESLAEETVSGDFPLPKILGISYQGDTVYAYFLIADKNILKIGFEYPFSKFKKIYPPSAKLRRASHNPIIEPDKKNPWESIATFNPGAFENDGIVHFLYRAIGEGDNSMLGYAMSEDGFHIDYKHTEPAFSPIKLSREPLPSPLPKAFYASGGGLSGGCEDPRLINIDNKVYLLYTAFDGWASIRIALSSIQLKDFLEKKWNWSKPVFLSPPGEIHKNWVIFPEKIKGKFAILHGIHPDIFIEYIDNLNDFNGNNFIRSPIPQGGPRGGRKNFWDNRMRGPGAPPIKTKYGWLLLYHAMDINDPNRYKLGAMLLDLDNPAKVLYRSRQPILEPDAIYENAGLKAGVVYCCATVIKDNTLFVYYGGADTVTCVATENLDDFMKKLTKEKPFNKESSIIKIK